MSTEIDEWKPNGFEKALVAIIKRGGIFQTVGVLTSDGHGVTQVEGEFRLQSNADLDQWLAELVPTGLRDDTLVDVDVRLLVRARRKTRRR